MCEPSPLARRKLLPCSDAKTLCHQGDQLDGMKKALAERALNAEMDHHLAGEGGAGNSRNGCGRKNVVTEAGRMALEVPRDRRGSFEPLLIAKYQRRFTTSTTSLRAHIRPLVCALTASPSISIRNPIATSAAKAHHQKPMPQGGCQTTVAPFTSASMINCTTASAAARRGDLGREAGPDLLARKIHEAC